MKQLDLLIDDFLTALRFCIQRNPHGLNLKDFSKRKVWPTKDVDVAKNTLNQILTGQRGIQDQELMAILDEGDPEPVIAYLCHRYGYGYHPLKPKDLQEEILKNLNEAKRLLSSVDRKLNKDGHRYP